MVAPIIDFLTGKTTKPHTPLATSAVIGLGCALEQLELNIDIPDGLDHELGSIYGVSKENQYFLELLQTLDDFDLAIVRIAMAKEIWDAYRMEHANDILHDVTLPVKFNLVPFYMLERDRPLIVLGQVGLDDICKRLQIFQTRYGQHLDNKVYALLIKMYYRYCGIDTEAAVRDHIKDVVSKQYATVAPSVAIALQEDDRLIEPIVHYVVKVHPGIFQ